MCVNHGYVCSTKRLAVYRPAMVLLFMRSSTVEEVENVIWYWFMEKLFWGFLKVMFIVCDKGVDKRVFCRQVIYIWL